MSDDQPTAGEQADERSSGESGGVTDEQLPQDLVPAEDNPLAEAADEGESAIDPEIEPGGDRERAVVKDPDDRD